MLANMMIRAQAMLFDMASLLAPHAEKLEVQNINKKTAKPATVLHVYGPDLQSHQGFNQQAMWAGEDAKGWEQGGTRGRGVNDVVSAKHHGSLSLDFRLPSFEHKA